MSATNDEDRPLCVMRLVIAVCLLILLLSLFGCSPRIVEVEKPVIVEQSHTATHTDIVRDTLIWRDSIYHYVQGDTVVIEKWHNTVRIERVGISDTLRDTIPRIVTVTETRIVEKNVLRWWQQALIAIGMAALLTTILTLASKSSKFFHKH